MNAGPNFTQHSGHDRQRWEKEGSPLAAVEVGAEQAVTLCTPLSVSPVNIGY